MSDNPLLRAYCTKCGKNGMECQCDTFHPTLIIDDLAPIDFHTVERFLVERQLGVKVLTVEECKDLVRFITDQGYISHEFHPNIHKITRHIEEFINAHPTKNKGT